MPPLSESGIDILRSDSRNRFPALPGNPIYTEVDVPCCDPGEDP